MKLIELERHLWESAHIMTGPINASDYKTYIFPMESCGVIININKPKERKDQALFINGVKEVTRERAFSFLSDGNREALEKAFFKPESHDEIAPLVPTNEIRDNLHNLSIPLYVQTQNGNGTNSDGESLESSIEAWQIGRTELKKQSKKLMKSLSSLDFEV